MAGRATLTTVDSRKTAPEPRMDAASTRPPLPVLECAGLILGEGVVGIAVKPALARLRRADHGMARGAGVLAGVLVGRTVAAQRGAALLAGSQEHPAVAGLHALGALPLLGLAHVGD